MVDLTKDEMDDLLLAHEKAELEYDVEATMATLVANPHFEFPTLGFAIDGWDGVHAMYSQMIAKGARDRNIQADARCIGYAKNALLREAYVSYDNIEGKRVTGVYMVVVQMDPVQKKISGERMYADSVYTDLIKELLGPHVTSFPGISKIADGAPIVTVHDAFAAAAAKGITINNPKVKQ
jgi:hypothetical protein